MSDNDPRWYKEAIIYELHVRCFSDSNGDGIGDFPGLTEKLDYLQELGITAIWLLPFYPSPLKDDGYDISDYYTINPQYGTLQDFRTFIRNAHSRGIKVITELVLNHTSDQHPWFQRARLAPPDSPERNFYVWRDQPTSYLDARIIFQDFEASNWTWDPVAKAYFWHRFYSHQPDLNYDNPEVQKEIFKILHFWMEIGVDGVRLDVVPYLFEREGTSCENLPETHDFLKKLRKYVDTHFKDRMFLAEANQWPEETAQYFGSGDECHMAFHFPLMPRLFMAIQLEDSLPIIEILTQTPKIPSTCQWALFLRNHDELTLEMVTDEERDYMFRVYATDPQARLNLGIRRRLSPLLRNDRRKIELMKVLLFSLEGTPVVYYGDEIGMGDNIYLGDRNGVRTPMQWSNDRNAGFSKANPQGLYLSPIIDPEYHFETINVEMQQSNAHSLYWWMKQLILLRRRYRELAYGDTHFLRPRNRKVFAFIREWEGKTILIVANLSRMAQYVELNLSTYKGCEPVELFSDGKFPRIGDLPYLLTLSPYGYYWFSLEKEEAKQVQVEKKFPILHWARAKEELFSTEAKRALESYLWAYLLRKASLKESRFSFDRIHSDLLDHFIVTQDQKQYQLFLFRMAKINGETDIYPVWTEIIEENEKTKVLKESPERIILIGEEDEKNGWILAEIRDAKHLFHVVMDLFQKEQTIHSAAGKMVVSKAKNGKEEWIFPKESVSDDQFFDGPNKRYCAHEGDCFVIPAKIHSGSDVEREFRTVLSESKTFDSYLPFSGYLTYIPSKGKEALLFYVEPYVSRDFLVKSLAMEQAEHFLTNYSGEKNKEIVQSPIAFCFSELIKQKENVPFKELFQGFSALLNQAGETIAHFHQTVSQARDREDFLPIPFTFFYQRALHFSIRKKLDEAFSYLENETKGENPVKGEIEKALNRYKELTDFAQQLVEKKINTLRIRHHGHLQLDSLLFTGKKFLLLDFAGHTKVSLSEGRFKRSCFIDACRLIFSLFKAGFETLKKLENRGIIKENDPDYHQGIILWGFNMSAAFFQAYLKEIEASGLLPKDLQEREFLFDLLLLEVILDEMIFANDILQFRVAVEILNLWGKPKKAKENESK